MTASILDRYLSWTSPYWGGELGLARRPRGAALWGAAFHNDSAVQHPHRRKSSHGIFIPQNQSLTPKTADCLRPVRYPETGEGERGQPMNHNFSENLAKLCRTTGRPQRWGRSQPFRLGLEKSTSRGLTPAPLLWWPEGEETLTAIPPAFATSIRGQASRATQTYTNDTAPYGEQSIAAKGGQKRAREREAADVAPPGFGGVVGRIRVAPRGTADSRPWLRFFRRLSPQERKSGLAGG